jgi:DNA-binding MarR family transcriptional regulator
MNENLADQLIQSFLRFRKVGMLFHGGQDASVGEIVVMRGLAKKTSNNKDFEVSDFHKDLHITKPAVSQIYSSLEKKGYITRNVDTSDRRKIVATLTPKGKEILKSMGDQFNKMINEIITRMGEDNSKQLISLFNRLSDISEDMRNELDTKTESGGKNNA